ncbi:Gfo/Idh/MocA family oxidoreductase [Streptomyces pathocidini]|uniref:Gfo/Idh/MocA family protein n=1 Tax=Streptomyces pathocidini TaxID=1650571 RepID=UPI0033E9037E
MTATSMFDRLDADRPLKVVVAGAGAMGTAWARAVGANPRFELSAIVDADERRAKALAIRLRAPGLPVTASVADLAGVSVDICINATPPTEHFGVIDAALEADLAVLSEKPFTGNLKEAGLLAGKARALGKLLMVSQSRRYQPGLERFRAGVRRLGGLYSLHTSFSRSYPGTGFRARLAQPLLTDMAVHAFDAARYVTGAAPVEVYCDTVRRSGSGYEGPAEASAVFEMSDGLRFHYSGSWCAPGLPTPWGGRWRAVGTEGSVEWDGAGRVRGGGPDGEHADNDVETVDDATFDRDPVRQVARPLEEFGEALTTGASPWGEASDNLRTVAMVEAAVISAQRRMPVRIDELLAEAWAT